MAIFRGTSAHDPDGILVEKTIAIAYADGNSRALKRDVDGASRLERLNILRIAA